MRQASPTGGALGQVAVQELDALQSTLAALNQDQSPSQLTARLNEVKDHYTKWKQVVEQAGGGTGTQEVAEESSDEDSQALSWANANPNDPRAIEIKKRLGVP
jgi:hypothetical protein